jgi:hypothetical protein
MKIVLPYSLVLASSVAAASPMIDMPRKSLSIEYPDGDRLDVICDKSGDNCVVKLRVAGTSKTFRSNTLAGAEILPWRAKLYVSPGPDRANDYSFEVSVVCPDDISDKPMGICNAYVSVQQATEPKVEIVRPSEPGA